MAEAGCRGALHTRHSAPLSHAHARHTHATHNTLPRLMLKDLNLALEAAAAAKATLPATANAATLYSLAAATGSAGLDFSAIYKLLKGDAVKK